MRRGRTWPWIRMRPFFAQFTEPVWSSHLPSWADFITTTSGLRFAAHTARLRCSYGAPWRIDQGPGEANEIPYHAVLAGSATLEDPAGGRPLQLKAGDILLLPGNSRHVMHDGSGAAPLPARNRASLNFTISENLGSDERLDLLCGHFAMARRRSSA